MIEKVLVFIAWCCVVPFIFLLGYAGWHEAIWPPSYMADDYALRAMGAGVIGTLFPLVGVVTLVAQVEWWFSRTRQPLSGTGKVNDD
jgi:TRAP-type C4-dicarboxylate transport system permease small subunit